MRTEKKLFGIILFISMFFILKNISNAANASINCSSTATVNTPVTITVSGSGVQWNLDLKINGQTIASNNEVDNYQSNKSISFSGTYTPTTTGVLQVTLTGSVTEYSDGSTIDSFTSKSITVTSPSSGGGSSSGGNASSGASTSSGSNIITSLQVGDKTYSKPNKDITLTPVDASTESITIKPTTTGGASYTINGGSSTNVALKTGTNVITIAVSGGDTYKVRITRLAEVEEVKPNIIDETEQVQEEEIEETKLLLSSLKVKNFELTPEFNGEVYSYTINIDMKEKNVDKLDIDAIANAADATVEIIGNENLVEGENIITILVKSADGEESVVYQIIVNKIDSSSEIVSESPFDRIGFLSDMEPFQRNILIGFSAFILLLVIIVIVILVKKVRKNKEPQIPFEGINSEHEVDEAQGIADEEQKEVEIIEESEEPKAEEEQTKQEDSNETFETMNTTLLDEEKAALMDEFFSYNQSVEDNTKAEKKKDKKKGRGKGKHF